MKGKKEMQHGDQSKYLNQQQGYSFHKDYRRMKFITDSSDIKNNFSVINQDAFPATLVRTNYFQEPLIENIAHSDMLSDGFPNLVITPNAKSFKMTLPIKTRKEKRASGFDKRKTTCML